MHRFKIDTNQIDEGIVTINGTDAKHLTRVLRLQAGEKVIVFDGFESEYLVTLTNITPTQVTGEIVSELNTDTEPPINITLIQGLPKQVKMELIVQKCTELGVVGIKPVITERTVINWNRAKREEKASRWQKIAVEASKQCRRKTVPRIEVPESLEEALAGLPEDKIILIPWEGEETRSLKSVLKEIATDIADERNIYIAIGPEGGFTQEEVDYASKQGAFSVTLGPRILRTETAGLATVAMTLYELGDLGG